MFKRRAKHKKDEDANTIKHLIAKDNPKSPITEQFRTLRTNIQFSEIEKEMNTILIASADASVGKSTTAANLAIVYAQQGLKTLLIDADMRKPTMHYTFKLNNLTGLSTTLINGESFVSSAKKTDVDHLFVLPCGPIPPNPAELLASNKFEEYLTEANKEYDAIIIDTPPILAVTDAKILMNIVDGVIFVARSEQTEVKHLEEVVRELKDSTNNLLGVVLNDLEKTEDYYYYS